MGLTVGIDLGTTFSCVAFYDGSTLEVLEAPNGRRTVPSVVAYNGQGTIVGQAAMDQIDNNVDYTYQNVKRLLGQEYLENQDQGFQVVEGEDGEVLLRAPEGKAVRPEAVSTEVLKYILAYAEEKLGSKIDNAVITVPAYFFDAERKATMQAGYDAGLKEVNIVNEPTAACLAYSLDKQKIKSVVVYDLGGGTFDVSVMQIGRGGKNKTLSTNGNMRLGGIDFDKRIAMHAVKQFREQHDINLAANAEKMVRIMREAEAVKRRLTEQPVTQMDVPFIANDANGVPLSLKVEFSQEMVATLCEGLIKETLDCCQRALQEAERTIGDIKEVILVGGMTRMPAVREATERFFKRAPNTSQNPDEVVARGAAIKAAAMDHRTDEVFHQDVTPHSVGFRASGGAFHKMIKRGTALDDKTGGATKTVTITSARANQGELAIAICEGDAPNAVDNAVLHAGLLPIELQEAGEPSLELTIGVDLNGLVSATVNDGTETISLLRSGED